MIRQHRRRALARRHLLGHPAQAGRAGQAKHRQAEPQAPPPGQGQHLGAAGAGGGLGRIGLGKFQAFGSIAQGHAGADARPGPFGALDRLIAARAVDLEFVAWRAGAGEAAFRLDPPLGDLHLGIGRPGRQLRLPALEGQLGIAVASDPPVRQIIAIGLVGIDHAVRPPVSLVPACERRIRTTRHQAG